MQNPKDLEIPFHLSQQLDHLSRIPTLTSRIHPHRPHLYDAQQLLPPPPLVAQTMMLILRESQQIQIQRAATNPALSYNPSSSYLQHNPAIVSPTI
jgi:hypothetical protein